MKIYSHREAESTAAVETRYIHCMSKCKKLSHAVCCCTYHVVWVPKYRRSNPQSRRQSTHMRPIEIDPKSRRDKEMPQRSTLPQTSGLNTGLCLLVIVTALASFNPSVSYSSGITYLRQQQKIIDTPPASALRSHPGYLQGFIRLGYSVDGEMFEIYSSAFALVFDRDCVHFLRELSESHPLVEEKIIGALQLGLASDSCLIRIETRSPRNIGKC